jgi:hypothetical protein
VWQKQAFSQESSTTFLAGIDVASSVFDQPYSSLLQHWLAVSEGYLQRLSRKWTASEADLDGLGSSSWYSTPSCRKRHLLINLTGRFGHRSHRYRELLACPRLSRRRQILVRRRSPACTTPSQSRWTVLSRARRVQNGLFLGFSQGLEDVGVRNNLHGLRWFALRIFFILTFDHPTVVPRSIQHACEFVVGSTLRG